MLIDVPMSRFVPPPTKGDTSSPLCIVHSASESAPRSEYAVPRSATYAPVFGLYLSAVSAAIERVLHKWSLTLEKRQQESDPEPDAETRVFLPGIRVSHALSCGFSPIAFDGADRPVITRTLLSALSGLRASDEALYGEAVQALGADVLARAKASVTYEGDREILDQAARRMGFGE